MTKKGENQPETIEDPSERVKRNSLKFFSHLSNISVSVEEANFQISEKLNQLLEIDTDIKRNEINWVEIITKETKLDVGEEFKDLSPLNFEEKVATVVDNFFPTLTNLDNRTSSEREELFLANLPQLKQKLVKIVKYLYMLTFSQNAFSLNSEELVFYGVVFTIALDKVMLKFQEFMNKFQVDIKAKFQEIKEEYDAAEKEIKEGHLAEVKNLMDVILNPVVAFSFQLNHLLYVANKPTDVSIHILIEKIRFLMNLFGRICQKVKPDSYILAAERMMSYGRELILTSDYQNEKLVQIRRSSLILFLKFCPTGITRMDQILGFAKKVLGKAYGWNDMTADNFKKAIQTFTKRHYQAYQSLNTETSDFTFENWKSRVHNLIQGFYVISNEWADIDAEWFFSEFLQSFDRFFIHDETIISLNQMKIFLAHPLKESEMVDEYEGSKIDLIFFFATAPLSVRDSLVDTKDLSPAIENRFKYDNFYTLFLFINGIVSVPNKNRFYEMLKNQIKPFYPLLVIEALAYREYDMEDGAFVPDGRDFWFVNIYQNGKNDPNWLHFVKLYKGLWTPEENESNIVHYAALSYFLTKAQMDGRDEDLEVTELKEEEVLFNLFDFIENGLKLPSSDATAYGKGEVEVLKQSSKKLFSKMGSVKNVKVREEDEEFDGKFKSLSKLKLPEDDSFDLNNSEHYDESYSPSRHSHNRIKRTSSDLIDDDRSETDSLLDFYGTVDPRSPGFDHKPEKSISNIKISDDDSDRKIDFNEEFSSPGGPHSILNKSLISDHDNEADKQYTKNVISRVHGLLTPEEIEDIENAPDLVRFVERMKSVIDPVTGEETIYHLTYVVPPKSKCREALMRRQRH